MMERKGSASEMRSGSNPGTESGLKGSGNERGRSHQGERSHHQQERHCSGRRSNNNGNERRRSESSRNDHSDHKKPASSVRHSRDNKDGDGMRNLRNGSPRGSQDHGARDARRGNSYDNQSRGGDRNRNRRSPDRRCDRNHRGGSSGREKDNWRGRTHSHSHANGGMHDRPRSVEGDCDRSTGGRQSNANRSSGHGLHHGREHYKGHGQSNRLSSRPSPPRDRDANRRYNNQQHHHRQEVNGRLNKSQSVTKGPSPRKDFQGPRIDNRRRYFHEGNRSTHRNNSALGHRQGRLSASPQKGRPLGSPSSSSIGRGNYSRNHQSEKKPIGNYSKVNNNLHQNKTSPSKNGTDSGGVTPKQSPNSKSSVSSGPSPLKNEAVYKQTPPKDLRKEVRRPTSNGRPGLSNVGKKPFKGIPGKFSPKKRFRPGHEGLTPRHVTAASSALMRARSRHLKPSAKCSSLTYSPLKKKRKITATKASPPDESLKKRRLDFGTNDSTALSLPQDPAKSTFDELHIADTNADNYEDGVEKWVRSAPDELYYLRQVDGFAIATERTQALCEKFEKTLLEKSKIAREEAEKLGAIKMSELIRIETAQFEEQKQLKKLKKAQKKMCCHGGKQHENCAKQNGETKAPVASPLASITAPEKTTDDKQEEKQQEPQRDTDLKVKTEEVNLVEEVAPVVDPDAGKDHINVQEMAVDTVADLLHVSDTEKMSLEAVEGKDKGEESQDSAYATNTSETNTEVSVEIVPVKTVVGVVPEKSVSQLDNDVEPISSFEDDDSMEEGELLDSMDEEYLPVTIVASTATKPKELTNFMHNESHLGEPPPLTTLDSKLPSPPPLPPPSPEKLPPLPPSPEKFPPLPPSPEKLPPLPPTPEKPPPPPPPLPENSVKLDKRCDAEVNCQVSLKNNNPGSNCSEKKSEGSVDNQKEKQKKKQKEMKKKNRKRQEKKKKDNDNTSDSEEGSYSTSSSSSSSDSDSSSDSNSSSDDEDGFIMSRSDTANRELERRKKHPRRLHDELWHNDPGLMNDGPVCRCSAKARRFGIRHGFYPGEERIPFCDMFSNNKERLYHYRITISPPKNFLISTPTVINHDGHEYIFEGFSIFSHYKLDLSLPPCKVIRFNIRYDVFVEEERFPESFCVKELLLFETYLFREILELVDLKYDWNEGTGCSQFHLMPRFVRQLPDNGQEILSMSRVLIHLLKSDKELVKEDDLHKLYTVEQKEWQNFADRHKGTIVTKWGMKPCAVRVDQIDRDVSGQEVEDDGIPFPLIVHFGIRPPQLSYAGNAGYQRAWRRYVKYRHLLSNMPKPSPEDKLKLFKKELKLQAMRTASSLKRDVTVAISSRGFRTTGICCDLVQHAMLIPVLVAHLRFHKCLETLENCMVYPFHNRYLLQLAMTHPSYRENFGTNPDHARNALTNCGIRQPEYGDRRIHYAYTRKRGINTLINIMAKFGADKETESDITHNERLEFLGDAVVEFVTSIHLFHIFPDLEEGGLATYRAAIVQNQHLAVLAQALNLDQYMLYAHGSDLCHDSELRHAMANCFEALMGALFLDGGIEAADRVFGNTLFGKDPVLLNLWTNYPKHPLQQEEPNGDRHWVGSHDVLQKLAEFENNIGVEFSHIRLLARAFTDRSLGYNNLTRGSNQRLEFLGDTVLQLISSEYLYRHFPDHHEGHLSLLRSSLVNNRTQSIVCDDLGMPSYAMRGDPKSEMKTKDRADLLEAFLGALYIDKGLNYCHRFCQVCFFPRLSKSITMQEWNDPKSKLQQCCLTLRAMNGKEPDIPQYKVTESLGPTNTRTYIVAVYFRGNRLATARGHSIQEAEMNAAACALEVSSHLFPQLNHQKRIMDKTKTKIPKRHQ